MQHILGLFLSIVKSFQNWSTNEKFHGLCTWTLMGKDRLMPNMVIVEHDE